MQGLNDDTVKFEAVEESNDGMLESPQSTATPVEEAAAAGTPAAEDTASLDGYRRIADAQAATINEMADKIVSLQAQIAQLISGGAQVTDGGSTMPPEPASAMPDDYVPLAELDLNVK